MNGEWRNILKIVKETFPYSVMRQAGSLTLIVWCREKLGPDATYVQRDHQWTFDPTRRWTTSFSDNNILTFHFKHAADAVLFKVSI
jgi:hypothetical protein